MHLAFHITLTSAETTYYHHLRRFVQIAPNPTFCVPSQFKSWSAHPFEPPSETYVSALHDMWSMNERKLLTMESVQTTSFVANSFVQLETHSLRKSVQPLHVMSERNLSIEDTMPFKLLSGEPCLTAVAIMP